MPEASLLPAWIYPLLLALAALAFAARAWTRRPAPAAAPPVEVVEMAVCATFVRTDGGRDVWACGMCAKRHRLPRGRSGTLDCRGCGVKMHAGRTA